MGGITPLMPRLAFHHIYSSKCSIQTSIGADDAWTTNFAPHYIDMLLQNTRSVVHVHIGSEYLAKMSDSEHHIMVLAKNTAMFRAPYWQSRTKSSKCSAMHVVCTCNIMNRTCCVVSKTNSHMNAVTRYRSNFTYDCSSAASPCVVCAL